MRKSVTKIVKAVLGFTMAIGAGVGAAMSNPKVNPVYAVANGDLFERISAVGDLADGDEVIFVNQGETYACGTTQNTNNRTPVAITTSNHAYTYDSEDSVQVFVVKKSGNNYGFHTGGGYIYSASSTNNNLKTNSTSASTAPSGTSAWSLSVSNYVFSATNVTNTSYYLAFNGTTYFSQYKQGQSKPYIYKRTANAPAVEASPSSVLFRIGDSSKTITATADYFSGSVSYSWAFRSGIDCVNLANANTATVSMTPKNNITELSTGVYRVTASYSSQSATADVTVTVDRGGSTTPYSISQARAAITSGVGVSNAYAKGVVYQVDSYNETYNSITYWISDDGSSNNPLEVYGGLAIDGGTAFSSKDDIKVGDIVVVKGDLSQYKGTYQFNKDNHLISKISVASIAVKTAPTKTSYNSTEFFDPDGLVVTATYDDTPNPTTKDFAYANLSDDNAFAFDPTTSTGLTTEDHVEISLFGQTTNQAISVTVREITGVALDGDMSHKSYYYGDEWDLSGLYLSLTWNTGLPAVTTVNLTSVDANDYDLSKATPERGDTSLYIYGIYEGFDFETTVTGIVVGTKPVQDILRTASTSFNLTDTAYTDFSDKTNSLTDINSGVTWAGKAARTSKTYTLQLNGTSRGIYTTASSGQFVKSVSVDFGDDNDKELYFYASNTAYSAINDTISTDENSTLVATLDGDTTSANISGNYKYLYIYSSGVIYMNSITITWKLAKEQIESTVSTKSSLAYTNYTNNGNGTFTYENLGIRFGGKIDKDLWARLNSESDIEGYGVLFTSFEYLNAQDDKDLKNYYASADGTNIKKFTNSNTVHEPAAKATPTLVGDDYTWMLYYRISSSEYVKNFVAVAFIIIDHDVVFFDSVNTSAGKLAYDLIDSGEYASGDLGGSLKYLADLYEETL